MNVPAKDFVLIAEVGCNHKGDMALAKQFVDVATSFCQVKHIKFQKRTIKELLSEEAAVAFEILKTVILNGYAG